MFLIFHVWNFNTLFFLILKKNKYIIFNVIMSIFFKYQTWFILLFKFITLCNTFPFNIDKEKHLTHEKKIYIIKLKILYSFIYEVYGLK